MKADELKLELKRFGVKEQIKVNYCIITDTNINLNMM